MGKREEKQIETVKAQKKETGEKSNEAFAYVNGEAYTEFPQDLYIPPEALAVILEVFEGPLDLLLYLIRCQNIDILDINVAEITRQYIAYINMVTSMQFTLAAEYLVMAAMLAEIKSRMLLPRSEVLEEEEDPRAQLIRRLQEYERYKQAAEDIDALPRIGRDVYLTAIQTPENDSPRLQPEVDLQELMLAFAGIMRRAEQFESHHVSREKLSTRERMTQVLNNLQGTQFVPFVRLFSVEEGRPGVVVTFLAVMELIKESLIELVQNDVFGPIHVKAKTQ